MSPAIYPSPVTFYNNLDSAFLTTGAETLISDFIDETIISQNPDSYERLSGYAITIDPENPADILGQVSQLDDAIFDQVKNGGASIQWGSVYINDLENTVGAPFKYSSVLLLNSTAQSSAGAFGAMIHTAFLKDYLSKQGKLGDSFNLELVD